MMHMLVAACSVQVKRERLWESPYYGRVTRCTSEEGIWYLVQVSRSQR